MADPNSRIVHSGYDGYGGVSWPISNSMGPSPSSAFGIPQDAYVYLLSLMGEEGKKFQEMLTTKLQSGEIQPDQTGTIIDRFLRLRGAFRSKGDKYNPGTTEKKFEDSVGWNETSPPEQSAAFQMDSAGENRVPGYYTEDLLPGRWYGK